MVFVHQPVMLKEVMDYLDLQKGDIVLDATIGGGGHSKEIIKKILPGGRLIGIDSDDSAIKIAEENLKEYTGSFKLINENFRNLDRALITEEIKTLDGILLDIGISSYQMDDGGRGFGIRQEGRLDMRMDRRLSVSAYDIVNRYKEKDLSEILEKFGEERFHKRIARYIAEARVQKPIETTKELAEAVKSAVGARYGSRKIDPATRTFQAIRIAVNDELGALEEGLKKAVSWLACGARICVISFHSLEDRIVKNLFKGYADLGIIKIITKKPLRPMYEEVRVNPRARSARLRVAERI